MGPALRSSGRPIRCRRWRGVGGLIGKGGKVEVGDGEIGVGYVEEEVVGQAQKRLGVGPAVVARVWFVRKGRDRSTGGGRRRRAVALSGGVHGAPGPRRIAIVGIGWSETREGEKRESLVVTVVCLRLKKRIGKQEKGQRLKLKLCSYVARRQSDLCGG